jgi:hypothetical protein
MPVHSSKRCSSVISPFNRTRLRASPSSKHAAMLWGKTFALKGRCYRQVRHHPSHATFLQWSRYARARRGPLRAWTPRVWTRCGNGAGDALAARSWPREATRPRYPALIIGKVRYHEITSKAINAKGDFFTRSSCTLLGDLHSKV